MLRKNQILRLSLSGMTDEGYGVGRAEGGMVVFVSGGVAGDVADVRLIKVKGGYAIGKIESLVTPSPDRVPPVCATTGCGGCAYGSLSYEREKAIKRDAVVHAFATAGLSPEVLPVRSTGATAHYRNKAQYPIEVKNGKCTIGFYAPRTHRVVEAAACALQPRDFTPIVEATRAFILKHHLSSYDEESGEGLLRHLYLREASGGGDLLVTLVINGRRLPNADEFVRAVREASPRVTGVLLNVNTAKTNVICGDEYIPLFGNDYIRDTLCGVPLKIHPASFYQVNHDAAELLYRTARDEAHLTGDETLVDLFCGAGSVGLSMADGVRELIGIEIVPDAVACARENARAAGVPNARFYCGDACDAEGILASAEREAGRPIEPDVVVLDPPRRGCGDELVRYLSRLAPEKIVYISCNPATLARDCSLFAASGYTLGRVIPVDLFPRTGHVECVVLLQK